MKKHKFRKIDSIGLGPNHPKNTTGHSKIYSATPPYREVLLVNLSYASVTLAVYFYCHTCKEPKIGSHEYDKLKNIQWRVIFGCNDCKQIQFGVTAKAVGRPWDLWELDE